MLGEGIWGSTEGDIDVVDQLRGKCRDKPGDIR